MITRILLFNGKSFTAECPLLWSWLSTFARPTFKFLLHFFSCDTVQKNGPPTGALQLPHVSYTEHPIRFIIQGDLGKLGIPTPISSLSYGTVLIRGFLQCWFRIVNPIKSIIFKGYAYTGQLYPCLSISVQCPVFFYEIASEEENGPTDNSLH